ncbi:unnamed protein product [Rhizophagus irregularis]|nr:unnamed protein product [Rhizophagus irregularis]
MWIIFTIGFYLEDFWLQGHGKGISIFSNKEKMKIHTVENVKCVERATWSCDAEGALNSLLMKLGSRAFDFQYIL